MYTSMEVRCEILSRIGMKFIYLGRRSFHAVFMGCGKSGHSNSPMGVQNYKEQPFAPEYLLQTSFSVLRPVSLLLYSAVSSTTVNDD